MILHLQQSLDFTIDYTLELIRDVPDDIFFHGAGPGLENHPAFTLGHLATAAALTSKYLGHPYTLSEEWDQVFRRKGPGDLKVADQGPQHFPAAPVIVQTFLETHRLLKEQLSALDPDQLRLSSQWRFGKRFPDLGGLLTFLCFSHSSMHLGQLAAWRRAKGYPSALAKL